MITAFLTTAVISHAIEKGPGRDVIILPFDQLSISANVSVVLYESADISTVMIKGKTKHTRRVVVLQKDSKLLITSGDRNGLKKSVTVYIPVKNLKSLDVSEDASVTSQTVLQSPSLQLKADESCEVSIIVNGKVQMKEGKKYAFIRNIKPEQAALRLSAISL